VTKAFYKDEYYVVVGLPNANPGEYVIFKGRPERSAANRARDYLLDSLPGSRADYEAEHGSEVSDKKWIKALAKEGFTITLAELMGDASLMGDEP
jgi:hypothetical protein